jgi:hypothetical protein
MLICNFVTVIMDQEGEEDEEIVVGGYWYKPCSKTIIIRQGYIIDKIRRI